MLAESLFFKNQIIFCFSTGTAIKGWKAKAKKSIKHISSIYESFPTLSIFIFLFTYKKKQHLFINDITPENILLFSLTAKLKATCGVFDSEMKINTHLENVIIHILLSVSFNNNNS